MTTYENLLALAKSGREISCEGMKWGAFVWYELPDGRQFKVGYDRETDRADSIQEVGTLETVYHT